MTRRVDWPLLQRTVLFGENRVPTPTWSRLHVDLPDSTVRSQSFEDLRAALEPEGEVVTQLEMAIHGDRLQIRWLLRLGSVSDYALVTRGPDRDLVLGAAAALRRELPGWREEGKKGQPAPQSSPSAPPDGPEPWVLIIGGTVAAGIILGLLTGSFGLAG